MMTSPPRGRLAMSIERPVAAAAGVAAQLPRDRRRRSTQALCDLADTHPGLVQVGYLDPLVLRQQPGTDLPDRESLQARHEADHVAVAIGLVSTRPVAPGRPGNADLPAAASTLQPRARNSMNR